MREVHFCVTCDFRLPYCVRSDRRFCGQQCRLWWYRHRGTKRPDFPPGGDRYPATRGRTRGRPKTFAAALAALADARAQVARMEATARQQQTLENHLRNHLMDVTAALTSARADAIMELDALRDELDAAKESAEATAMQLQQAEQAATTYQTEAEQHQQSLATLQHEREAERAQLTLDLAAQQTAREADAAQWRTLQSEHAALRGQHASLQQTAQRDAAVVHELTSQREAWGRQREALNLQNRELTRRTEELDRQNGELTRRTEELSGRLSTVERTLSERDGELRQQRQHFAAAERAHQEIHAVAESESRSLRAEIERRIAAEKRVEQLMLDLDHLAADAQLALDYDAKLPVHILRDQRLVDELADVRRHRDDAIAERELLAARILKLMAPGQYLEHAAAAGYDVTQDPLIRLKRSEVLVENRLAAWQESHGKRRRARRLDPEQTLDEQAYAAALSSRWKQIDHPHLRRKHPPKWVAVGFLLDAESERYLLTLTEERIEEMRKKMEAA